jgi:importin-5
MLLACGKTAGTLTQQMVAASYHQIIHCIAAEHDSSFLASLYKCFCDTLRVLGGPSSLPQMYHTGIIDATKRQLQSLADKRKARADRASRTSEADEREDMALLEEIEDFALEEMGKMLAMFDQNHPLLVAIGSVRDLGFAQESDEGNE